MPRLTPAELDALEAALKDIVEGMSEAVRSYDNNGPDWTVSGDAECFDVARIVNRRGHIEAADAALPALLAEIHELRSLTTPEVIGEKHRDGEWWLVWAPGAQQWMKCRWLGQYWGKSGTMREQLFDDPTHALPLPPAPEEAPNV